jgi:hypothetical protein
VFDLFGSPGRIRTSDQPVNSHISSARAMPGNACLAGPAMGNCQTVWLRQTR